MRDGRSSDADGGIGLSAAESGPRWRCTAGKLLRLDVFDEEGDEPDAYASTTSSSAIYCITNSATEEAAREVGRLVASARSATSSDRVSKWGLQGRFHRVRAAILCAGRGIAWTIDL